jgi:hypothetical protein
MCLVLWVWVNVEHTVTLYRPFAPTSRCRCQLKLFRANEPRGKYPALLRPCGSKIHALGIKDLRTVA